MNPIIFKEAAKIWKNIARSSDLDELRFELEVHKQLLSFFQVGDYYYYIFNINNSAVEFMSDGITTVLGYDPKDVDVPFLLDKIHPDDQPWFLNFEHKVGEFFASLHPDQIPNYKVRYDYRIRKTDDTYIRILQQVVTIQHEGSNLLRSFGVHTDITHIKPDGVPVLSFIGMNGEPSYLNVDVQKIFIPANELLTSREKQVLRLVIEGKDSNAISEALFISKLTVDTHRRNLLKKSGCANTSALTAVAIKKGWV